MVRALLRLILILIIVVAIGAFLFGYRWGGGGPFMADRPVGTSGERREVSTERAREAGAEIAEKVAESANEAQQKLAEASLTAKIKSKLALDDYVEAARIDVDTDDTVITLSGTVRSEAERRRALTIARETVGVTSVVDHLTVMR